MHRRCEHCGAKVDFRWAVCQPCREARDASFRRMPAHVALGLFTGAVGTVTGTITGQCIGMFAAFGGRDPHECVVIGWCIGGAVGFLCLLAGLSTALASDRIDR